MYLQGQRRDSQQHLHDLREHLQKDHHDPENAIAEHSGIADDCFKSLSLGDLSRIQCKSFTEDNKQYNSGDHNCQNKQYVDHIADPSRQIRHHEIHDRLRDLDGEFTLAMLDLDHFKHINDTYGHLAGDAALSRAAQAIRSAIRTGDELVRYGGDEFFLLFHDMPRNALKKKLESIRAAVENLEFPEYPGLRITVSIGGARAVGPLADTVQKADHALYHAKAAKNRTVLYKEDLQ